MSHNGIRDVGDVHMPDQSRNRNSNRRGRGRQNYDRGSNGRGNRDRRNGQWREVVPTVIDVDDAVQFPSITETATAPRKPRGQVPPMEPVQVYYTRPHANSHHDSSYYGGQRGNRNRGSRYQNNGRAYNNNINYKRPIRYTPPSQILPPGFMPEPLPRMIQPAMDLRNKPEIDCVRQVEYYFSEMNLVSDQYLRNQMDSLGYVSIELIHCFKRIAAFKLSREEFVSKIRSSDRLETNRDGTKVRVKGDWERWIKFNEYIRDRDLQDIVSNEFVRHYIQFMRSTYGSDVNISPSLLNPPSVRPKVYQAPFRPTSFPPYESLMPPVSFYPPFDPSIMYQMIPNPYQMVYPSYTDYSYDYGYVDQSYYPEAQYVVTRPTDTVINNNSSNVDSVTNLMGQLRVDDKNSTKNSSNEST